MRTELSNIILGFAFDQEESQVGYYDRTEQDAISAEIRPGSGRYIFPSLLSKRAGKNEWHCGIEALYFTEQEKDVPIDNLYALCESGTPATVEGQEYEPGILLALYLKQILGLLGITEPGRQLLGIMMTVPRLSRPFVETIRFACEKLGIPKNRSFLQDYTESFYYYSLYQRPEMWSRNVGLFAFAKEGVTFSSLSVERGTKPATVRIAVSDPAGLPEDEKQRDDAFCRVVEEALEGRIYSSVYLVGKRFSKSWAVRSTALLCRQKRHVFHGNNLYVKGACYAACEKVEQQRLKGYLYVGSALVKNNIGMQMQVQGSPSYQVLLSAGVNWYDAHTDLELILDNEHALSFVVSAMETGKKDLYTLELPDLPVRPNKTTRLHVHLEYESAARCLVEAEDLGFGEMYPATHKVWREWMEG